MVRTPFLVVLLILFLCAFLGLRPFVFNVLDAQDVSVMGISIFGVGFQVFLALAIIFLEFAIFFFSMLDRIGDTIKAVLKPLVSLVPLAAFVASVQKAFTPIFLSVLPDTMALEIGAANIAANAGFGPNESYIAQAVQDGSFTTSILFTVGTMFLFAFISYATAAPRDFSEELRKLRAENARFRKLLQ